MANAIKKFVSPSKIIFNLVKDKKVQTFTVEHAQRGDTFLYKDSICMLTTVSAYPALCSSNITDAAKDRVKDVLNEAIFVTNLQTGRTFAVKPDDEIQWIKVTMTVESE